MGPNPNGPRTVSFNRVIRYSALGVLSVGPLGDFLDKLPQQLPQQPTHPSRREFPNLLTSPSTIAASSGIPPEKPGYPKIKHSGHIQS